MKDGKWHEWMEDERQHAIEAYAQGYRFLIQLEEKTIMARDWSDLAGPMYFRTLVDLNSYKNRVINPVRVKWSVDLANVKSGVVWPNRG
jgi:hypothetical protein